MRFGFLSLLISVSSIIFTSNALAQQFGQSCSLSQVGVQAWGTSSYYEDQVAGAAFREEDFLECVQVVGFESYNCAPFIIPPIPPIFPGVNIPTCVWDAATQPPQSRYSISLIGQGPGASCVPVLQGAIVAIPPSLAENKCQGPSFSAWFELGGQNLLRREECAAGSPFAGFRGISDENTIDPSTGQTQLISVGQVPTNPSCP